MPNLQEIQQLVEEHQRLDEPMTGAIWLNRQAPDAWLLEIMPEVPLEANTYPPFVFGPGPGFPYALNLIAGPEEALLRDIEGNLQLAGMVADGEVVMGDQRVVELVAAAQARVARG